MLHVSLSRRGALLCLATLGAPRLAAAEAALPGNSVYQYRPALTDQNGQPFDLAAARGQPYAFIPLRLQLVLRENMPED